MKAAGILIVTSSGESARCLQKLLSPCGVTAVTEDAESEVLKRLRDGGFYAVVLYVNGIPIDGRQLLLAIRGESPSTPVVVITEGADGFARWWAAGAFDCLVEPVDRRALSAVLERAISRYQLCTGARPLRPRAKKEFPSPFSHLIGHSDAMRAVYH